MKESYGEGLASHTGSESCAVSRKATREALTGAQTGRVLSREIMAPGKYLIFAWDGVESGEWEDPEFLKANAARGVALEVSDSDTKSADLQLIQLKSKTNQAE